MIGFLAIRRTSAAQERSSAHRDRISALRGVVAAALAAILAGCHLVPGSRAAIGGPEAGARAGATAAAAARRPLAQLNVAGRVAWGLVADRHTAASPAEVVGAATVSFIDASNTTVATGKTDPSGNFSLNLSAYTPVNGATYILEAVKGLGGQAPGSVAARFRTILQWNGTGWLSATNAAVGGSIVINALTTALAIESALDPAGVPPSATIGKVNISVSPAVLAASPAYPAHPDAEIATLANDLLSYLSVNADPISSVGAIKPTITGLNPNSGPEGSLVGIGGLGFSPVPGGNTVTFSGATAQVVLATPTQIVAIVPAGAASGQVRVQTTRGLATSGSFTVVAAAGTLSIAGFSPAGGRADTVVSLSGEFNTAATPSVTFAGPAGADIPAAVTAWSSSSMTVVAPVGVVPGAIKASSGIATAASPQAFAATPGDVGIMTNTYTTTANFPYTMPISMYGHFLTRSGDAVYVLGGYTGSTQNTVWMFPIRADGSIGRARRVGSLNTGRYYGAAFAAKGYLYASGGYNNNLGNYVDTIERAAINPDGTLGPFVNVATLKAKRYEHQAVVNGDFVYIMGGYFGGEVSSIERWKIEANGSLTHIGNQSLNISGTPITNRLFGAFAVGGKYLVTLGGYLNSTYSRKVVWLPINADGSLANGRYDAIELKYGCYAGNYALENNIVYQASGHDGSSYHGRYSRAPIDPVNGKVNSAFDEAAGQIWNSSYTGGFMLLSGGHLYTFGGYSAGAAIQSTTLVSADGGNSGWAPYGGLQSWRYGHTGEVIDNKLWVFGGYHNGYLRTTEHVAVQEDGSLGPSTQGPPLSTNRYNAATLQLGGFVYIFGGHNGSSAQNTIERARINADGTLGSWAVMPMTMRVPRYHVQAVNTGKYVYLIGGHDGSPWQTMERAVVNADGSLSQFELADKLLPDAAYHFAKPVVVKDYVYLMGEYAGGITGRTLYSKILPDGSLGSWNLGPALKSNVYTGVSARIGNYLYLFGGWNGSANWVQRALISPDGSLGNWEHHYSGRYVLPFTSSHVSAGAWIYRDHIFHFSGHYGPGDGYPGIAAGTIR